MTDPPKGASPEAWRRAGALFNRMQDAEDPLRLAAEEPDENVAALARRLWDALQRAESDGFLAAPIELVAPPAPEPRFREGQVLAGRFEIQRMLGAGGMGEVYLAFDRGLREAVAIKTIRAALAADPAIRRRFVSEVQNARRVTHPNVCRINDLFEDEEMPFLSMEYLEGPRLSDWLANRQGDRRTAQAIGLQLAEGLAAAHRVGILHCDFKPANVVIAGSAPALRAVITDFGLARALRPAEATPDIAAGSLRAGTLDYMAPELRQRGEPSIRTDIYAYGCVLGQLLPNNRLAARCRADRAKHRPASLQPVIHSLRGGLARRLFLGAGIAAAGAVGARVLMPRPGLPLAARTRIAINGFKAGEAAVATVFRELLITSLRQSTLLTVMADDHLRSLLKSHQLPATLPAERTALTAAAGSEAALVIEGVIAAAAKGLKVSLDVFTSSGPSPALSVTAQVADARMLVQLADQSAIVLRREFGESAAAIEASRPLEQVTSAVPEAVNRYFEGMREYDNARADPAITCFRDAVRLDPAFALAHLQLAVALIIRSRYGDAFGSYREAFRLRERTAARERLWIEAQYYNATADYDSGIRACEELVRLYPEEAKFHRQAGFLWARLGRPEDALPHDQRAVELDPNDPANLSEDLVNHVDAHRFDEAIARFNEYRKFTSHTLLNWGAGLAHAGKDDLPQAHEIFVQMGFQQPRERWSKLLRCGPLMLMGRFQEARSSLVADIAWDEANHEQSLLHDRRVWLGFLSWMMEDFAMAREQLNELLTLEALPPSFRRLREAGLLALFLEDASLARSVLDLLRSIESQFPSAHTSGARAVLEAALMPPGAPRRTLFDKARGLRPDPMMLYPAALAEMDDGDYSSALATLDQLERQRAHTLRVYSPPLTVMVRVHRARCLEKLSRLDEARPLRQWVRRYWKDPGLIDRIQTQTLHFNRKAQGDIRR